MSTFANPIDTVALELDQIQGNILAGFNKDHQRFLFLRIDDVGRAKTWLKTLIPHVSITTAVKAFNDDFKATRRRNKGEVNMPTATWLNVAFTFAGLTKLGAEGTRAFPVEFQAGMASRKTTIGDLDRSDPTKWQAPFNDPQSLHVLVILAADLEEDLKQKTHEVVKDLEHGGMHLLHDQHGEVRPDLPGHEHFGFKDGVSQPGVKGFTLSVNDHPDPNSGHQGVPGQDLLWPGEFVLGYPTQVPTTQAGFDGPNPTPGPNSSNGPAWTKNGSYLVFRKLRQDVAAFKTNVNSTAASLGIPAEVFGAKIIGRYASGCPIQPTAYEVDVTKLPTLAPNTDDGFPASFDPNAGDPSVVHAEMVDDNLINNFEYGSDLLGTWVPRGGHVRKAYPRDEQFLLANGTVDPASALNESFTQTRRLLRRGIPFGPPFHSNGTVPADDGVDRGLLFLCYQKSIATQFEFVQSAWVNNPNFPQAGDGVDPVMAQSASGAIQCPIKGAIKTITVPHFVVTEGGEYFFQPSISALHTLAS